ncbi:MAG TPA: pyruvate dehydrogenase (acetyl-transferring), homodimeric type [Actinomycetota bacterium]|nr:pyruvate dehydrogenase (acetyl-transferring), homodimeric type [Actinomycetota bacterium]
MPYDVFAGHLPDPYPDETAEWLAAIDDVADTQGRARARYLLHRIFLHARQRQIGLPSMVQTDYINTIPPESEPYYPGNEALEFRIRQLIRWNAAVTVIRANKLHVGIGGHLATYASAAGLYEVGFNHFFRGKDHPGGGDQVWLQGHAAPGIYARGYLEGRITEQQLEHFRREAAWKGGLSSYPHPRLMPDFWEFPSVSMGLAPISAIYQARFNRYLHQRGIKDTSQQRVWAFLGDGEMDEPESVGALHLAANEPLGNLIFVVNCNLQRLDGPVRGNAKIIQELESLFQGAGWNVIKVIWGREWDDLLARDAEGALVHQMNTTPDGEFQRYSIESGAYIREHFFGPDPRLRRMVEHLSDDDLWRLKRGGHDYRKVYAAYQLATEIHDKPTVILAKTVKGWALGPEFEARNAAHQIKKMNEQELKRLAERLNIEVSEKKLSGEEPPFFHPGEDSDEVQYLKHRRKLLGGFLPQRRAKPKKLVLPGDKVYDVFNPGTESSGREVSTTMAFVALLRDLMKEGDFGRRVVPIIPDEGRTFGLESLFKEFKIHSSVGQLYEPVDYNMLLSYSESRTGQILEEGITEAGSMASMTAAGTSYASHGEHMVPFFLFYSMFGFQRIGDLIWAFADARGRGFLLGCTAGRTTLNGEGLQHADGHSLLVASTVPNCMAYDPAFAYETAEIVQDGLRRMIDGNEDIFYYLALYNENYPMPEKPPGIEEGILKGIYKFRPATHEGKHRVQLLGSGPILATQVLRAQKMLDEDHDVAADVWSVTSYKALREDCLETERWNRLHPEEAARPSFLQQALNGTEGPLVAASDWIRSVPDQISRWVPQPYVSLGTDGFGRSDTRENLRRHFEVDAEHIVVAALAALAQAGEVKPEAVQAAIERYGVDPETAYAARP